MGYCARVIVGCLDAPDASRRPDHPGQRTCHDQQQPGQTRVMRRLSERTCSRVREDGDRGQPIGSDGTQDWARGGITRVGAQLSLISIADSVIVGITVG